jgi:hypothetical protein
MLCIIVCTGALAAFLQASGQKIVPAAQAQVSLKLLIFFLGWYPMGLGSYPRTNTSVTLNTIKSERDDIKALESKV